MMIELDSIPGDHYLNLMNQIEEFDPGVYEAIEHLTFRIALQEHTGCAISDDRQLRAALVGDHCQTFGLPDASTDFFVGLTSSASPTKAKAPSPAL